MVTEGLTADEEKTLVGLLQKVGAKMSQAFFNAVADKFRLTAIETVVLERNGNGVKVLLTERGPEDVFYPRKLHSPGSMSRRSDKDENFAEAIIRVQNGEISAGFVEQTQPIKTLALDTLRGPETAVIHVCRIKDKPAAGEFFDVTNLPENLIQHHHRIIEVAAKYFRENMM
jgi:hypothetical protein